MGEEYGLDLIDEDMDWEDEPEELAPRWLVILAVVLVGLSVTAVLIIGAMAFSQGLFPGQSQPRETEPDVVSLS